MSVETDSQGRIYLSAELRERFGEKFHVVEYDDRIELVPIDDDPLQAVRDEVGDALDGKSAAELREEALERAREEAQAEIERGTGDTEGSAE